MSNTYHTTNVGRYYLGRQDRQQQVVFATPFGTVSELWDVGDCEYDSEMEPGEVLDLIEARLKSYWIATDREQKLAKIAKIREHLPEVTADWARGMAIKYQKRAADAALKARAYASLAIENEAAAGERP